MDIVSFNEAATANGRIEKFNGSPDSNFGIVTVPKEIPVGETVKIPAGRVAVLPNTIVNGTIDNQGEIFVPSGSSIDFANGLKINGEYITTSVFTSYHLLKGNLLVDNSILTNGFSTTLYSGTSAVTDIVTDIDMDTQWGDTTEEKFGGLVWLKSRSAATNHFLFDTIRGSLNEINSNTTEVNAVLANSLTNFNNNGFTLGNASGINVTGSNYVSWTFGTTHRRTGVTNHGKPYTCHYNPYTGFTIVKYEGSGIAGHEIPHHLGRELSFRCIKNLSGINDWISEYDDNGYLNLNTTNAYNATYKNSSDINKYTINSSVANWNASTNQYILYGWANSYFDESNKLIGNYEIGVYQGTGAAGNKITTRGKPGWIMIKRLDSTGDWNIFDSVRVSASNDGQMYANSNIAESIASDYISYQPDGFTLVGTGTVFNAASGQYLYIMVYDNDSGSGKSKYPKTTESSHVTVNSAIVPLAKGIGNNGNINEIQNVNTTVTGITFTEGINYLYKTTTGFGVTNKAPNYGVVNPANGGDFYDIYSNTWYTSSGSVITESRNYMNHIVVADDQGNVIRVEALEKTIYFDDVNANEYKGKNVIKARGYFDGTTTPVTTKNSFNLISPIRTATGIYKVYFEKPIEEYSLTVGCSTGTGYSSFRIEEKTNSYFIITTWNNTALANASILDIIVS